MKRRSIHQTNHLFDPYPFEAFWAGSWQPVELLKIDSGTISTHILENEDIVEEEIPMSHLRVRSRKATWIDCTSFLRSGIDICVLYASGDLEDADDERNDEPVRMDARLRSIKRNPHDGACDCEFHVSFYVDQGPDLTLEYKKLSKETHQVKLDQIYLLQRLEMKPCGNQYYRWGSSEDCFSLQKFKLFSGTFCSDLTWLLVASIQRHAAFNVRSLQNRVAYEVSEDNPNMAVENSRNLIYTLTFKAENEVQTPVVMQFDPTAPREGSSEGREVGFLCSYDLLELRRSKRRNIQPERYLACDNLPDYEVEVTRLGESKTHHLEFEGTSSEESEGGDDDVAAVPLSVQADNEYQQHRGSESWIKSYIKKFNGDSLSYGQSLKSDSGKHISSSSKRGRKPLVIADPAQENELSRFRSQASSAGLNYDSLLNVDPENESEDVGGMLSKYFYMNASPSSKKKKTIDFDFMDGDGGGRESRKGTRRKYHRKSSYSASLRDNCVYVRESIYDVRSFRKGSKTAQLCRDLIKRCMINIDATLKNEPVQPPVLDQWKEFQSSKSMHKMDKEEKPLENKEEEISEIDMLWKEMEVALATWYLFDDEESHNRPTDGPTAQVPIMASKSEEMKSEKKCEHDFILNEQEGTVCRFCGFVETDIKDIVPPFEIRGAYSCVVKEKEQEQRGEEEELEDGKSEGKLWKNRGSGMNNPCRVVEGEENVWALIPAELKEKLRVHQKNAFEFLWRNIGGSLKPCEMVKRRKKRGGCVISHTPGAGKTLLIIAFLVSYLKLFPGSRPLVLAPKTTLYTWYKEIIKWKVAIPVYQIHGGQTYKGEVLKKQVGRGNGLPRNQDVMHVLDCLEKMQRWVSHPSILLMGYTSFLTLTREDSHYAHRKYMAQLLKQCPGILILDEGHNPRSTKSRLRKGLMKVDTRLRILLSGTLFQNNFGEYFNTLCLARPSFVHEVLRELDPKYEYEKRRTSQFSLENRGRKLVIDRISRKIESNKGGEREEALKTLKKLTGKFIDVYEGGGGGGSDGLPGLQCYTLMMKSTTLQQRILFKLQNSRPLFRGFPLELELLITLAAIHPWLIRTTACSTRYFSAHEWEDLERYKLDIRAGSKVRFVMNLIPRCLVRGEKLLIFCHNISPINLLVEIFEKLYGWRKGREVLVLQGDMELFERGRVMDKFEEAGGVSKVMLASITACAEGISLTAASRVILLDSEWNPSKTKQAIARAFRPGQNKVVYVYQLLANATLEEEKHSRTTWKEWVSDMIFSDDHVQDPSHWQAPNIEDELLREIVQEDRAALFHKIMKNEKASSLIRAINK